jgi:hypothetical protein
LEHSRQYFIVQGRAHGDAPAGHHQGIAGYGGGVA